MPPLMVCGFRETLKITVRRKKYVVFLLTSVVTSVCINSDVDAEDKAKKKKGLGRCKGL